MGEFLPLALGLMGIAATACGAVAFLWVRNNEDRRETASAIAAVRAEAAANLAAFRAEWREDVKRLHDRVDEKVGQADLGAMREDFRQIREQLASLNANVLKFMASMHAAE